MMEKSAGKFLSEPLEMLETAAGGEPVRFRCRQIEHRVTSLIRQWQDFGFSAAAQKRDWRNRRHRNYYEIRTDQEAHLLVYFDRGVKPGSPRAWVALEEYDE